MFLCCLNKQLRKSQEEIDKDRFFSSFMSSEDIKKYKIQYPSIDFTKPIAP